MTKEYGKFTEQQLRNFIGKLPELFESRSAYHAILQQTPSKLQKHMPNPISWSWAYELSMEEHVEKATVEFGLDENVKAMNNSADPQQAVLNDFDVELPPSHKPLTDIQTVLELTEGMILSYECMLVYGKYINEIIADVRDNVDGAESWLFKAIRIDPNVITGDTAQDRLCRALMLNDRHFMNELQKALKGRTGAQAKYLNDFRFLMQLLHESDAEDLTNNKIKELVLKLGLYTSQGDVDHNITELIRKYRKS